MVSIKYDPTVFDQEDKDVILSICDQYWKLSDNGKFETTTTDICDSFNLKTSDLTKLVKQYSSLLDEEAKCQYCNELVLFTSRSEYTQLRRRSYHAICEKKEYERQVAERKRLMEEREQGIKDKFKEWRIRAGLVDLDVTKANVIDLIYLYTLMANFTNKEMTLIKPLNEFMFKYAPTDDKTYDVICHLLKNKYISISETSDVSEITSKDGNYYFDHNKVAFSLNFEDQLTTFSKITEHLRDLFSNESEDSVSDETMTEISNLYDEILVDESIAYMDHMTARYRINFSAGDKTKQIFKYLASKYKIGEIHFFIWMAVKDVAAGLQAQPSIRGRITNSLPNVIKKKADYFESSGKEIRDFAESKELPYSAIYSVLQNIIRKQM